MSMRLTSGLLGGLLLCSVVVNVGAVWYVSKIKNEAAKSEVITPQTGLIQADSTILSVPEKEKKAEVPVVPAPSIERELSVVPSPEMPVSFRASFDESWGQRAPEVNFTFMDSAPDDALEIFRRSLTISPEIPVQLKFVDGEWFLKGAYQPGVKYLITYEDGNGLGIYTYEPRTNPYPRVSIDHTGLYLPRGRTLSLPVRVSAADTCQVTLSRSYDNNVLYSASAYDNEMESYSQILSEKKYALNLPKDGEERVVSLDLNGLFAAAKPGLYGVRVSVESEGRPYACSESMCTLIYTSLNPILVASGNIYRLFVLDYATAAVLDDVQIRVVTDKYQTLFDAVCPKEGLELNFDFETRGEHRPRYIVVSRGDDMTYLDMDAKYEMMMRGDQREACERNDNQTPYVAELYAERGVVRPGEKVTFMADVRETQSRCAAADLPLTLLVQTPTGDLFARYSLRCDTYGQCRVDVIIPSSAKTGIYHAQIGYAANGKVERIYDSARINVSAYVPDQVAFELASMPKTFVADSPLTAAFSGHYYYGPAAANMRCSATASFEPCNYTPDGGEGYSFGLQKSANPAAKTEKECYTDTRGNVTFSFDSTADLTDATALLFAIEATLHVPSGRAVSASRSVRLPLYDAQFGLAQNDTQLKWILLPTRKNAPVKPLESRVVYEIYVKDYARVAVLRDGQRRYDWKLLHFLQSKGEWASTQTDTAGVFPLPELDNGNYLIRVRSGTYVCECPLTIGSIAHTVRSENPAELIVQADKKVYNCGELAMLTFEAAYDGTLIVAEGEDSVHQAYTCAITKGKNTLEVTIPKDFSLGSYHVLFTLVYNDAACENMARCQRGAAQLAVNQNRRKIWVDLALPEGPQYPGSEMPLRVRLTDEEGAPLAGAVNIYGVDEGILALSAYQMPNLFARVFGRGSTRIHVIDTFKRLYDYIAFRYSAKIGGDADESAFERAAGLKTAKAMAPAAACALYDKGDDPLRLPEEVLVRSAYVVLPQIIVGADGTAQLTCSLPDYTGNMRFMAVAANTDRCGTAQKNVIVADPISAQIFAPRAIGPEDTFELTVTLNNHYAVDSHIIFMLDSAVLFDGFIAPGSNTNVCANVQNAPGKKAHYDYALKNSTYTRERSFRVPVRYPSPYVALTDVLTLAPGAKMTLFDTRDTRMMSCTQTVQAALSFLNTGALREGLQWLNNYPHGCLEQTVSQLFPYLSIRPLVTCGVLDSRFTAYGERALTIGLNHLTSMRLGNGRGFSMWPRGEEAWGEGTLYLIHFLREAGYNGLDVSPLTKSDYTAILQASVLNPDLPRLQRMYALSVADKGDGDRFRSTYAQLFDEKDSSMGLLYAAVYNYECAENRVEGLRLIKRAIQEKVWNNVSPCSLFDTLTRNKGLALYTLCRYVPELRAEYAALALELIQRCTHHERYWGSTQDNAWAVLGLSAYAALEAKRAAQPNASAEDHVRVFSDNAVRVMPDTGLLLDGKERCQIVNGTKRTVYVTRTTRGVLSKPVRSASGMTVSRVYFDQNGNAVTRAKKGDLLTVRVTYSSVKPVENFVLCDLLCGGLEIEDETLATRAQGSAQTFGNSWNLKYTDKRDDALLLYGNCSEHVQTFEYKVRAVTRGRFGIPTVSVEAMYDPEMHAVSATDAVFVVE